MRDELTSTGSKHQITMDKLATELREEQTGSHVTRDMIDSNDQSKQIIADMLQIKTVENAIGSTGTRGSTASSLATQKNTGLNL